MKRYIEIYREFMFNSLSIYNIILKQNPKPKPTTTETNHFNKSIYSKFSKTLCQEFKHYLPDIKSKN